MKTTKIKEWIINNLLTIIMLLIDLSGVITVFLKSITLSSTEWALLSIIGIDLLIIIIRWIWLRCSCESYHYPKSKIATGYRMLQKTISYTIETDGLHITRGFQIESTQKPTLSTILDKFIWTGEDTVDNPIPNKHIKTISSKESIGVWKYFSIDFDMDLHKRDTIDISYRWPTIRNFKSSSPFVSTSTEEPTKNVVFYLDLGKEYANAEIILEECRAIESDHAISSRRIKLNDKGIYNWKIQHPKRFRHYRVRWNWIHNKEIPEN